MSKESEPHGQDFSDDRLSAGVIEAAPDGIVVTDCGGRIVLVNAQIEEQFGYRRNDLLGQPVDVLLPDGLRGRHRAHEARYRAEPRTRPMGVGLTLKGQRADGVTFPVEISLSPLTGEGLVVASVRDISERLATEASMRQLLFVLDHVQDGVFLMDRTTRRFIHASQGAIAQVGYDRGELSRMGLLHLMPHVTEAELEKTLVALDAGGAGSQTLATTFRRKDGTDIPVELLIQMSPDQPDGVEPPVVVAARDTRARLTAEAQLRDAGEQLAAADERDRIAGQLRETVIRRVFAAGLSLHVAMGLARDPTVARRLDDVVNELDAAIRDVQGAVFGMRAGATPRRGLPDLVVDAPAVTVAARHTPIR